MSSDTNSTAEAGNAIPNTSFPSVPVIVQESIKLERGMRGAYAWEIKILPIDGIMLNDLDLKRLKDINDKVLNEYGAIL